MSPNGCRRCGGRSLPNKMSLIQLGLMLLTHPTRLRAGYDSFWHVADDADPAGFRPLVRVQPPWRAIDLYVGL